MNKYNELRQEINKFLGQKKQQIGIMENLMDNLIEWDKSISSSENALLKSHPQSPDDEALYWADEAGNPLMEKNNESL